MARKKKTEKSESAVAVAEEPTTEETPEADAEVEAETDAEADAEAETSDAGELGVTVETKRVRKSLKCTLTDRERIEAGEKMADALEDAAQAESAKKAATTQYKAEQEAAEKRANAMRHLVRNGYEYRDVDCEEVWDWDEAKVTTVRNDTGEIVEERAMHYHERQRAIPGTEDEEGDMPEAGGDDGRDELAEPGGGQEADPEDDDEAVQDDDNE